MTNPSVLFDRLSNACSEASSTRVHIAFGELSLLDALASPYFEVSGAAMARLQELASPLTEAIVNDDSFPGERVLLMRVDGGSTGFYPNFVAPRLLRRALKTNSPQEAIDWLRKVLMVNSATGKTIRALWGVPIEKPVHLTPEVELVPTKQLPDSAQKRWLGQSVYFQMHSPISTAFAWTPPQSALVIGRSIEPLIFDAEVPPESPPDTYLQVYELLYDITRVLTLIGPRSPIMAAQWFNFDDPDIEEAALMSGSRSGQLLEVLPILVKPPILLDLAEAPKVVQAFLALSGTARNKIRVALDRLNQAQRRHGIGDRAMELCIAFEALVGDAATTEMTHKVKVRAVRLLGGASDERVKNSQTIKIAYDIRSKLVHTGHVEPGEQKIILGEKFAVSDILDKATTLCADLIKILIFRGSIPDWPHFDIAE